MGSIATLIGIAWALQDLTYSPGWIHPMAYFCAALYLATPSSGSPASSCAKGIRNSISPAKDL